MRWISTSSKVYSPEIFTRTADGVRDGTEDVAAFVGATEPAPSRR